MDFNVIEYIKSALMKQVDCPKEVYIEPALYYKLEHKFVDMHWGRVELKCQR